MTGSLQEKNGKYYAVLNIKDEHGKRKPKWISTNLEVKGNKKNAEKILRNLLDEWEDDNYKRNNILVSDYFIQWLQNIEYKVQPNTYRGYSGNMNNHIIPYFKSKNIMIQDLKHYHLEDYYNSKLKGDTPLSPTTIKHHHQNITKALNDAVKREIINFNPSVNAETPKCKKYKGNFLNTEQINQLLTVCKGTIIEISVYIMAYYGLRRSEVLGLTWKSIDFVNNKMTIQQTVQQHTGGSYIHDTKNESSYRSLPLTNIVIELLQTHKKRQDERKKIMGNCYIDNDFVCTWEDGKPITPNYLTKTFHQIIVKCESLPLIRLHDLRHSAASNLLSLGFNIVQVQEWLGHSSPSTTLNFYSHVDVSSKKDIGNALDKIIKFDMR